MLLAGVAIPCFRPSRTIIGQHRVDRIGRSSTLRCKYNLQHVLFKLSPFGTRYCGALANDLEGHLAEGFFSHNASGL
jgi:hypothetical protein